MQWGQNEDTDPVKKEDTEPVNEIHTLIVNIGGSLAMLYVSIYGTEECQLNSQLETEFCSGEKVGDGPDGMKKPYGVKVTPTPAAAAEAAALLHT